MAKKEKDSLKSTSTILMILGIVLLILLIGMYGEELIDRFSSSLSESTDVQLTLEEEGFVDMLLEEWSQDFRLTTVRQTALNEGVEYNHDFRYRIASYLARTPSLHRQLIAWKFPMFVLSNDEKRVAKYILMRGSAENGLPAMEEMQKALNLDKDTIKEAYFILYQLGFLNKEKKLKYFPGPFSLNPDHEEQIPSWSLHYFEMVREDGRRLNVQCVLDAMKLVYEDFAGEEVTLNTYCPDCLQSITITAKLGELVEINPHSTVVLKGGSCTTNLAFVSSQHLKRWAGENPSIQNRKAHDIYELLELIKEER
jgi:hypothetical protein